MRDETRIVLDNDPARLPDLVRTIASFGERHGVPEGVLHDVRLALEEVVVNVMRHACGNAGAREIAVRMAREEGGLVMEVRDDGRPFDPLAFPPPDLSRPLEGRAQGGLGVFLARSAMDSVEYRREGNANVLTMRKALPRAGG